MGTRDHHHLTASTSRRASSRALVAATVVAASAWWRGWWSSRTGVVSALVAPPSASRRRAAVVPLGALDRLVAELGGHDRDEGGDPRVVFVGGKGGVGKTTVSSALAVMLASDVERDQRVLVVSTDPAHSLGDALDCDLRTAGGGVVPMTDPLTGGRLFACEVDPSAALDEFRAALEAFDVGSLADALGVSPAALEGLGLREFSDVLRNPPPGLDELVALAEVLGDDDDSNSRNFDAIVVDTAPTGHTLRLLELPTFLDGLLGRLLRLRQTLGGLASTLQSLFGDPDAAQRRRRTIDDAVDRLESFRTKMTDMQRRLRNASKTSFVVVTVPTKMAVAESRRLLTELGDQGVAVTDVVVNQCVVGATKEGGGDDSSSSSEALSKYYERRKAGQTRWINELTDAVAEVSRSEEYRSNGRVPGDIHVTRVPYLDAELVGVPALGYLARSCLAESPGLARLLADDDDDDDVEGARFVVCGGKGGVGKTTTSSALAVAMAAAGHRVALVSTDPAHSLGDALDVDLRDGASVDVPLVGVATTSDGGSLTATEVDPAAAAARFRATVDDLARKTTSSSSEGVVGAALGDLGAIFDTLPPGADEVVALAGVVKLLDGGNYDRVVLDTAPTGHTLRMLDTPGFVAGLINKVLDVSRRINANPVARAMIASGGGGGVDLEETGTAARAALASFQLQMYDLEDVLSDADRTEFLVVSIPTELAVRESVRLLNDLTFDAPDAPVKVRNVVMNQVLPDDDENDENVRTFLERVERGQAASIRELTEAIERTEPRPILTTVPYLDTEPRGVFGLKALSYELLDGDDKDDE